MIWVYGPTAVICKALCKFCISGTILSNQKINHPQKNRPMDSESADPFVL